MINLIFITITFLIDNLFSEITYHNLVFSSLIIIFLLTKNKNNYLILITILGSIYDLFYHNKPIYFLITLLIGIIISLLKNKLSFFKLFLVSLIIILLTNSYILLKNKKLFILIVIVNISYFLINYLLLKDKFMSYKRYSK